jgi:dienelactone hydrolase
VGTRLETWTDSTREFAAGEPRALGVVVTYPAQRRGVAWSLRGLLRETCAPDAERAATAPTRCENRLLADLQEYRPERGVEMGERVLDEPLGAARDVPMASGRHPVVVFDGGLTSDALSYVVLAELLASRGFVSVSLPSLPLRRNRPLAFDLEGVESKAADVSFALAQLGRLGWVDDERVAVAAWSVGGVSSSLAALRSEHVRAVVSLDGGLGYDYGGALLVQAREPRPGGRSVPLLHLTGTAPNPYPVPKDTAALARWPSPHVYIGEVTGINHSHFVTQGGAPAYLGDDSAAARAFWSAQTAIVETLAAFLETAGRGRFRESRFLERAARAGVTIRRF